MSCDMVKAVFFLSQSLFGNSCGSVLRWRQEREGRQRGF